MILRQGLVLALIGAGIGLTCAAFATRALSSLLYGISAHDPVAFALVVALMLLVSLVASYIPARRATKVDPVIALRYE